MMLYENLFQLIETINFTFSKQYLNPCLTLLYSGIDIVSSLDRQGKTPKEAFLEWTEKYLLSKKKFECTSLEIYAARCGLVHTFTSQSNLTRSKKARSIIYSWGSADPQKLERVRKDLKYDDSVVVHIDDLIEAFKLGLREFIMEIDNDKEKRKRVSEQSGLWFVDTEGTVIDDYLKAKRSAR